MINRPSLGPSGIEIGKGEFVLVNGPCSVTLARDLIYQIKPDDRNRCLLTSMGSICPTREIGKTIVALTADSPEDLASLILEHGPFTVVIMQYKVNTGRRREEEKEAQKFRDIVDHLGVTLFICDGNKRPSIRYKNKADLLLGVSHKRLSPDTVILTITPRRKGVVGAPLIYESSIPEDLSLVWKG